MVIINYYEPLFYCSSEIWSVSDTLIRRTTIIITVGKVDTEFSKNMAFESFFYFFLFKGIVVAVALNFEILKCATGEVPAELLRNLGFDPFRF